MPFGKKQPAAAAPAAPAPSGGDGQRSDEIENLRAIVQGAGINPDDYKDESELREAARKVTSFLERQFNSDNVRFALQSSRQRLQAQEALDTWAGSAQEERIEVRSRAAIAPDWPASHLMAHLHTICIHATSGPHGHPTRADTEEGAKVARQDLARRRGVVVRSLRDCFCHHPQTVHIRLS